MLTIWPRDKMLSIRFFLILMLGGLLSCEEYKEGCMDASATNFQVSNQAPCCCEYPDLVFQTTLTDGEGTLSFADTFENAAGQRYVIRELKFLASNIQLSDSTGAVFVPGDTTGNYLVSPAILGVNVLDLNNAGANFLSDGTFDHLEFSVGPVEELRGKVPADFPRDHPLRDSTFYDFRAHSWNWVKVVLDVPGSEAGSLNLSTDDPRANVDISGSWTKTRGRDLVVNFRINITTLFDAMDFSLPEDVLLSKFKANLRASFEP